MADIITAPVSEFCGKGSISGLSRSYLYELIDAGEIETVLIGRRRLVLLDSYREYLARKRGEGGKLPRPGRAH